jgi:triacylglycerol esterase/lipase EstA (alpha/beta hydrolase family)
MTDLMQFFGIIITVIGSAYCIHRDIREDMKTQTARTDKLYEMFIDLVKEGRK